MLTPVKVLYKRLTTSGCSDSGTQPPLDNAEDAPAELTKTQYHILLGHSTLHRWVPNEHGRGILDEDKLHHDTKSTIPRNELLHHMYNVQPRQYELSDAVTPPYMRDGSFPAQFKPPSASSISELELGATGIFVYTHLDSTRKSVF